MIQTCLHTICPLPSIFLDPPLELGINLWQLTKLLAHGHFNHVLYLTAVPSISPRTCWQQSPPRWQPRKWYVMSTNTRCAALPSASQAQGLLHALQRWGKGVLLPRLPKQFILYPQTWVCLYNSRVLWYVFTAHRHETSLQSSGEGQTPPTSTGETPFLPAGPCEVPTWLVLTFSASVCASPLITW